MSLIDLLFTIITRLISISKINNYVIGESSMDMLVEIVSLLGPPNLTELKEMNIETQRRNDDGNEDDHNYFDDDGCSSLIELMLSVRTFKTFEERLRDKLERTFSGRFNVSSEIVDLIMNSLQYVAKDRKMDVPTF